MKYVYISVEKREKEFLDWSFYLDQHQKLMGSVLGRDPFSIQVWWKCVDQSLCNSADQPTNQQMDMGSSWWR